jgi:hypothetical protein
MGDNDLTELDERILEALVSGFPVSQSPYCDLGAELGISEIEVLNSAGMLRQTGAIARIAVAFPDPEASMVEASAGDVELMQVVSFDLPWSEHPYAEVAALLEMRGVDIDEAGVIDRIRAWLADGTASEVVASID